MKGADAVIKRENVALTSIRGMAALYVVLYHYHISNCLPSFLTPFFQHSYLAVDLFFVLSGFVMAMTYGHAFENGFQIRSYFQFIGRRIARIYPLYFVLIGGEIVRLWHHGELHAAPGDPPAAMQVLFNLLMVQTWGFSPCFIAPSWSISTEWAAYIGFPLLFGFAFAKRIPSLVIAAVCFLGSILFFYPLTFFYPANSLHRDVVWWTPCGLLVRCISEFTLGLLTYRVARRRYFDFIFENGIASLAIMAALLVLLAFRNTDLMVVFLIPFLIISFTSPKAVLTRWLEWPVLHWLGLISYSIYLGDGVTYFIPLFFAHHVMPFLRPETFEFKAIQLMFTLIGASLLYQFVEKPGRNLLRNLFAFRFRPKVLPLVETV